MAPVEGLEGASRVGLRGVGVPVHEVQPRKEDALEVGVAGEDPGVRHRHHHPLPRGLGPGLGEAGQGEVPLLGEEGLGLAPLGPHGAVGEAFRP